MTRERRLSFGGQAVENSLSELGFQLADSSVALVETSLPPRRHRAVLLQSAWNVVPPLEFRRLISPYPAGMKLRAFLRRRVALRNLHLAERIVCLTDAISQQLKETTRLSASVAPATIPLLHAQNVASKSPPPCDSGFAIVPGSMTWYKRPMDAISWCQAELTIRRVVFAGEDDGSGCWSRVVEVAGEAGIEVNRVVLGASELREALAQASVAILPSELESLGFGLSEALLHTGRVVARPIPAHIEIASRVGRHPEWMSEVVSDPPPMRPRLISLADAKSEWENVGHSLGLAKSLELEADGPS